MPRSSTARIDQILERVEALEEEVQKLRETLSPRERLRRAVDRIQKKTRHIPSRELGRTIDEALREVRRERAARASR